MAVAASIKTIYDAGSGVLFFGTSNHLPRCLTIPDERIVQVSAGLNHSAMVCRSGWVYVIGKCTMTPHQDYTPKNPKLVPGLTGSRIVSAACGNRFTCFLSATGELFTCGLNDHGQLGMGDNVDRWEPVKVEHIPKMKAVDAGEGHAVALSEDGQVWVAGYNSQGQLGLGHCVDQAWFTRISSIRVEIEGISCGSYHTALLTRSGILLVTGSNKYGVLGLGDTGDVFSVRPVSLPSAVAIAAVACGHDHTVALSVEGTVWSWGQNYYGQLGVGNDIEVKYSPTVMAELEGYFVTKVVAGPEHTALITDEGNVLVCGSGDEGELGSKERNDIYLPTRFPLSLRPGLKVEDVVCVYNGTLVLLHGAVRDLLPGPTVVQALLPQVAEAREEAPPGGITEWEKTIIATLECPICFKIMCSPIHQCTKGHNFCNACHLRNETRECCMCREQFIGTRNIALESLSDSLQLPCGDCFKRMPVTQLDAHGKVCPKRTFNCPLTKECGWTGKPSAILQHARSKHRYQTWEDLPRVINHYIEPGVSSNLLSAHGACFMLYRMFDPPTNSFRAVACFIGVLEANKMYQLSMEFTTRGKKGKEMRLLFNQDVCVDAEDIHKMLKSENAIVLKRQNFNMFFKHNQVTCITEIVLKE